MAVKQPIGVSARLGTVSNSVAEAAGQVQKLQSQMADLMGYARVEMGQSEDLYIFEQRLSQMQMRIARLAKDIDDYAEILGKIAMKYKAARENAVKRAKAIPR